MPPHKPFPWALTNHYGEKIALKWQFISGVLGKKDAPIFEGEANDLAEHLNAADVLLAMSWVKEIDLTADVEDAEDLEDVETEEGLESDEDVNPPTSPPVTLDLSQLKPVVVPTEGRIEIATPEGIRRFVQGRVDGESWEEIAPVFGISAGLLSIALLYAIEPAVSYREAIGGEGRRLLSIMHAGPRTAGEFAKRMFPGNSRGAGKMMHVMERLRWQGFVQKRFDEKTRTNLWECIKSMTNNDNKTTLVLEYLIGSHRKWGRFPSLRQIDAALGIKGNAPLIAILKRLEASGDVVQTTDLATGYSFRCLAERHRITTNG